MPCGAFSLCGAFSFCAGVRIYAAIRSEALKRFWAALRWRFRFGVAACGVAFCFGMLCNASKTVCIAFCGCGWYSL